MWPFMFHLRMVAQNSDLYRSDIAGRTDTLMREVVPNSLATFDLRASFGADSPYVDNVRKRSNILDLLVDVMTAHHAGAPFMGGQVLVAALAAAVPRAFWPGKEQVMATETWQVEELIEQHFGLPILDMASSVLTHGYADGGVTGVVLYMMFLGIVLGCCEGRLRTSRCALLGAYVYTLGVGMAVQVEANVTDVLVTGRFIIAFVLLDWLAGHRIERWVSVALSRPRVERPAWEA